MGILQRTVQSFDNKDGQDILTYDIATDLIESMLGSRASNIFMKRVRSVNNRCYIPENTWEIVWQAMCKVAQIDFS